METINRDETFDKIYDEYANMSEIFNDMNKKTKMQEENIKTDDVSNQILKALLKQQKFAEEERRFEIIQIARTINEEQERKTKAAIVAGGLLLASTLLTLFSGIDPQVALQTQLNGVYSWEAFKDYIECLGPVPTLLSVGSVAYGIKTYIHDRSYKVAQKKLTDMNASIDKSNLDDYIKTK